jgi:hypothetical protein
MLVLLLQGAQRHLLHKLLPSQQQQQLSQLQRRAG